VVSKKEQGRDEGSTCERKGGREEQATRQTDPPRLIANRIKNLGFKKDEDKKKENPRALCVEGRETGDIMTLTRQKDRVGG